MPQPDDQQLLGEFVTENSESAFAALVTRHVNLVYSTALRFTGNPHHAEEITQAVFIILARKAGGLRRDVVLSGWLYQTARLTAANFLKGENRRQRREQEAYMQSTSNEPETAAWNEIVPLLDDAMGGLGETDRNAVVLRFFENKTAREVAAALDLTEGAVHKRVTRALEKLQKFFAKRGITSTSAMIAGAISANSVQAAPAGLAKMISTVAVAKGAAVGTSTLTLVKGTIKMMTYAKLKLAFGIGAAVLFAGGVGTIALLGDPTSPPAPAHRSYPTTHPTTKTDLLIAAESAEAPDDVAGNLKVEWQPTDSGGATAMLTQEQHTNFIGALRQNRNALVLRQPTFAFDPPEPGKSVQGTAHMIRPVKVSGTNAETGTILDVTASMSADGQTVTLILRPEFRTVLDLSPQHDGSQNTIQITKTTTTATLTLNPSETLLIRQPVVEAQSPAGSGASKDLLLMVTPKLGKVVESLRPLMKIPPKR